MKTRLIFTLMIILYSITTNAQSCQWAKQLSSSDMTYSRAFYSETGNIYCYGDFSGVYYFQNDTLIPIGANDMFLAKFDANGNEIWAKRMGGSNPYDPNWKEGCVLRKFNDRFYLSGCFYGSLSLSPYSIYSSGGYDGFIACLDSSGNCLWLKKVGGNGNDSGTPLGCDAAGNIYNIGTCNSLYCTIDTFNVSGIYLANLDSSGNTLWVKNNLVDGCYLNGGIKVTKTAIYLNAITASNTVRIDTITFTSSSTRSILAKFNLLGDVLWVKKFNDKSFTSSRIIEVDEKGYIYNAGHFSDTLVLDTITISNQNKRDIFLTKLDTNGNVIWIRQCHADGQYGALLENAKLGPDHNIYISGEFTGSASFGSYNVTAYTDLDSFFASYDTNGNCNGVLHFGRGWGYSVDINDNGSLLLAGIFSSSGSIQIGNYTFTAMGNLDSYLAKFDGINNVPPPKKLETNELIIYANPNTGKCNIIVPDDFLNENKLVLCVYNNKGQLIQKKDMLMEGEKIFLDLEAEAKGMYTATLTNGKKMYSGKIIFE